MKTDIQRFVLLAIFALSSYMLWEKWQAQYHPVPVQPAAIAPSTATGVPGATKTPVELPGATPRGDIPRAGVATTAGAAPVATAATAGETVTIKTDMFSADLSTLGGVITQVALLQHRKAGDSIEPYLALQKNATRTFVAQTGLLHDLPNHYTQYELLPGPREMQPGQDTLAVHLAATAANGDKVVLTYTFHRGSYVIDVDYAITNSTAEPVTPSAYFQFTRDMVHAEAQTRMVSSSYVGPVIYNETDKYDKVGFDEIDKEAADPDRKRAYTKNADNGWVAMAEHYFVTAWLPSNDKKTPREFYTRKLDGGLYSAGVVVDGPTIAPGATGSISVPLYVGPQDQEVLAKLAPGLEKVVDYGKLTIISEPLFTLLKWLHGYLGNWGWSIIVMTIMLKGVFYPLNAASARSMAKMKIVAPKMKGLQEQFANDKPELQKRMMELYKTEKINPLGGCLPILVQIPVFIALYWVLLSAVELRHAPWIGWIKDLSAPDPYFVLPVLYAITAWLQVKLSPTPATDPMQQKMFQIMPIAFSVMFIFFPAGLVLYWLVNNLLQIAQQWHVNRMLTKEAALKAEKRR